MRGPDTALLAAVFRRINGPVVSVFLGFDGREGERGLSGRWIHPRRWVV